MNYAEQATTTNTFASDTITGVNYPKNKIAFGADGTATDVSSTNPLPVSMASSGTQAVTEATLAAGEHLNENVQVTESWFSNIGPMSASGIVKTGQGRFSGFIVTASTTGVIRFWANVSATGSKILDSMNVSAGQVINIPGGCTPFATGLYLEIVSGTATVTPFFN